MTVSSVAPTVPPPYDRNRNGELTYTELTTMLGGSAYQDFGVWMAQQGSEGFRKYDADRQAPLKPTLQCPPVPHPFHPRGLD